MFCNDSIHDSKCPSNKLNNALKGGSAYQQQTISFESTHVSLIARTLELARLYVTKNPQNFQEPQDMLSKINTGINIIGSKNKKNNNKNNSVKGAGSTNNICTRKENFKRLLEQFNLY